MVQWIRLAALALAAAPAQAADRQPSAADYPEVAETSFVEPSGDKAIQLSTLVPASPGDVFAAFTTGEGFRSWAVGMARIDLRIGGEIEASYDAKAKPGDPDNIRNRILAYVPDRLLVIRNVQAPRSLPGREAFGRTVTIIELAPTGASGTRVTLTNAGYGSDPDSQAAYRHFEWGDAYTLDALRKHFAKSAG
ncbi:MAG: hypothetical protein JWO25_1535 [Alphaproteobacteria bacterium]|nr:hypothetical protein [Alphaproteobacteria bacterium]